MSLVPIYGFAGRPALSYTPASGPVAMNTPCYAQWNAVDPFNLYCSLSSGAGWVKIISTGTGYMIGGLNFQMFATAATTINVALTWGGLDGDIMYLIGSGETSVSGGTASRYLLSDTGSQSDALAVPYYRYRIIAVLAAQGVGIVNGSWARLDFTLT